MKIVLLEDDQEQAAYVSQRLEAAFAGTDIQLLDSEASFIDWTHANATAPPDLFIIDVMVRWSQPGVTVFYSSPREAGETFERAGIRCVSLLQRNPRTAVVPVVLYSVLHRLDYVSLLDALPPHYSILKKEVTADNLILHIRSLFPNLVRPPRSLWSRLRESFGASASWLIFSIDLKKLFSKKSSGA